MDGALGHRAPQDGGGVGARFVQEHHGVGEPRAFVDRRMVIPPADSVLAAKAFLMLLMASTADPPMLIHVEVDGDPRLGVLVLQSRTWRLQQPGPTEPESPELGDRRQYVVRVRLGGPAPVPALSAALVDLAPPGSRQMVRRGVGPRGSVLDRRSGIAGRSRGLRCIGAVHRCTTFWVAAIPRPTAIRVVPASTIASSKARARRGRRAKVWVPIGF